MLLAGATYFLLAQQSEMDQINEDGYRDISSLDLESMMDDKDFLLINVHIPYDGEIDGTDLFIPFNEISDNLEKLPADKSSKIVVYCRSGSMSATASKELAQIGYSNILNLPGGMRDWKENGFTVINKD
jgi:rhodanese-related sulfurtransferase